MVSDAWLPGTALSRRWNPHTFHGRMYFYCPPQNVYTRISKSEIGECSDEIDASVEQRDRIRKLTSSLGASTAGYLPTEEIQAEGRAVRGVVRFLSYCGDLTLSGRLSARDLYLILGPEVARRGRAVRWACGAYKRKARLGYGTDQIDHLPAGGNHDQQEVVLSLVDVLWAQMARAGDHHLSALLNTAAHKKDTGASILCRKRGRRLAARHGHFLTAVRLSRLLRYSESLPFYAVFGPGRDVLNTVDTALVRPTLSSAWLTRKRIQRLRQRRLRIY